MARGELKRRQFGAVVATVLVISGFLTACGDPSQVASPKADSPQVDSPQAGSPDTRSPSAVIHRNAILITVDTLRADALGFAGNSRVATPVLDRLATAGRIFDFAHAHSVTTLPSHASILTGLYPYQHGARHNGGFVLNPDVPTLAGRLRDAGFATAAFVGAFPLASRFGLDRGFDVYDEDFGARGIGEDGAGEDRGGAEELFQYSERNGREVVERGRVWWRAQEGKRRFLWLHLFDPHAPYAPPEPFRSQFADAPYLGEVSAVDAYLSELLTGFLDGQEESTLIAFTSDHGEALGEHGELTHGLFAYESTLKVPLVLWGKGVEPGLDPRPARHVDLLPTVLAALGAQPVAGIPGRSLFALADDHPDISFFEALSANLDYGWAPLRGVLKAGKKYIDLPIPELYDLRANPAEDDNLFLAQRRAGRALGELLPAESTWPPEVGEISESERGRLQSLGYLGGPTAKKKHYGPEDDPKILLALDVKVQRMAELSAAAPWQAIELGREILTERPSMGVVYIYLSNLLLQVGDYAEAIQVMRRARQERVASRDLERQLGLTLITVGRAAEALEVLESLTTDPGDKEAKNFRALAFTYLGRYQEAESIFRQLLNAGSTDPRIYENLALLAIRRERYEEARENARRALELDPGLVSSWNNLGVALYNLGRKAEAIDAWKRSLALVPNDADTLLNLGMVEADIGNYEAAREALTRFLDVAPGPAYEAKRQQAREILSQLRPHRPDA